MSPPRLNMDQLLKRQLSELQNQTVMDQKYILDRLCISYPCFLKLIMEDSNDISEEEVREYWTGLLESSSSVGLAFIRGVEEEGIFSRYLEVIARYVVYGYPPLDNLLTQEEREERLDISKESYKKLLDTLFIE